MDVQSLDTAATGKGGIASNLFRALGVVAVAVGIGLEIASFITGKPFDIQAYGVGFATLLSGAAGGAFLHSWANADKREQKDGQ